MFDLSHFQPPLTIPAPELFQVVPCPSGPGFWTPLVSFPGTRARCALQLAQRTPCLQSLSSQRCRIGKRSRPSLEQGTFLSQDLHSHWPTGMACRLCSMNICWMNQSMKEWIKIPNILASAIPWLPQHPWPPLPLWTSCPHPQLSHHHNLWPSSPTHPGTPHQSSS